MVWVWVTRAGLGASESPGSVPASRDVTAVWLVLVRWSLSVWRRVPCPNQYFNSIHTNLRMLKMSEPVTRQERHPSLPCV